MKDRGLLGAPYGFPVTDLAVAGILVRGNSGTPIPVFSRGCGGSWSVPEVVLDVFKAPIEILLLW
jgi:hypothetical protein